MAEFGYAKTSNRERVCRICETEIARGEPSIVLKHCKIPGGFNYHDFHFHEKCFGEAMTKLSEERAKSIANIFP